MSKNINKNTWYNMSWSLNFTEYGTEIVEEKVRSQECIKNKLPYDVMYITDGYNDLFDVLFKQNNIFHIKFIIEIINSYILNFKCQTHIISIDTIFYLLGKTLGMLFNKIIPDIRLICGPTNPLSEYNINSISTYFDCNVENVSLAIMFTKYVMNFDMINVNITLKIEELSNYKQYMDNTDIELLIRYNFDIPGRSKITAVKLFIYFLLTINDRRNGIFYMKDKFYIGIDSIETYDNIISNPYFFVMSLCL